MKYFPDATPIPVLELSRRNLEALLAKLDDPASARTLLSPGAPGDRVIAVTAVEDSEHYASRDAGDVFMPTSGQTWDQPACRNSPSNDTTEGLLS